MRIANLLDQQKEAAASKKKINLNTTYTVRFSDDTRFESDTPEVFQEESLTEYGRPIAVAMYYRNYTDNSYITIHLTHGDADFHGNEAEVSGSDSAWLNANFQGLQDALNRVKRQKGLSLRRHQTLLLNLIALGIGSAVFLAMDLLDWVLGKTGHQAFGRLPAPWVQVLSSLGVFLIFVKWFFRWFLGLGWGAFSVRRWLLSMWPSIEFDFGLPHLQTEAIQRGRLAAVSALIIVPILISMIYDVLKNLILSRTH
jgi:hypothetical protein